MAGDIATGAEVESPPGSDEARHRAPGCRPRTVSGGRHARPTVAPPDRRRPDSSPALIEAEAQRQHDKLRMIASENYVSTAVLEATGTVLTNKYSEGYAGKRYYEGQQFIDPIETLAIERAKALFGVEHANVQPYSGSPANLAVYLAFLQPGRHGHGHGAAARAATSPTARRCRRPASGSGRCTTASGARPAASTWTRSATWPCAERPKMIICGGTAIPRTIDFPAFAEIAREVGAILVADIAHIAGLIAGGAHPSPVGHADVITTTTHKTLRGPRGAMIMATAEHATAIDKAVFPGLQGGPHNHTTAGIAVALHEAAQPSFTRRTPTRSWPTPRRSRPR